MHGLFVVLAWLDCNEHILKCNKVRIVNIISTWTHWNIWSLQLLKFLLMDLVTYTVWKKDRRNIKQKILEDKFQEGFHCQLLLFFCVLPVYRNSRHTCEGWNYLLMWVLAEIWALLWEVVLFFLYVIKKNLNTSQSNVAYLWYTSGDYSHVLISQ